MSHDDDGFRQFAETLATTIAGYGLEKMNEQELLAKQCQQFQRLVSLEDEFRETLVRSKYGLRAYEGFQQRICVENGNVLTARPYFRERQGVCIGPISRALKQRQPQSLYQYRVNYNFVQLVMDVLGWPDGKLKLLALAVKRQRQEIVELNMPLAISQARIFWNRAPAKMQDSRFSIMDYVQIGVDGLISCVDKLELPPGLNRNPALIRVWRAVAIGRMLGNFIEMSSETSVHFWPRDKRIIYHANKHVKDFEGPIDYEILAARVNADFGDDTRLKTTASELASMMGAAATALESRGPETMETGDDQGSPLSRAAATEDCQPDRQAEDRETRARVRTGFSMLPLLEQKLIRLRGVDPDLL